MVARRPGDIRFSVWIDGMDILRFCIGSLPRVIHPSIGCVALGTVCGAGFGFDGLAWAISPSALLLCVRRRSARSDTCLLHPRRPPANRRSHRVFVSHEEKHTAEKGTLSVPDPTVRGYQFPGTMNQCPHGHTTLYCMLCYQLSSTAKYKREQRMGKLVYWTCDQIQVLHDSIGPCLV